MQILAVNGVFLEIFQGIVHPAHVPFEQEAQAAIVSRAGDHGEGVGFLRRHNGALAHSKAGFVQLPQEVDGLQILTAAKLIGLVIGAVVVQIQHGADRIHPQAVQMEFLQPVHRAGDQKALDFRPAEIEDPGGPVGMLVHHRIGKLIAAGAVELIQAVQILGEVGRYPVHYDTDAVFVHSIYEIHKHFGRTET